MIALLAASAIILSALQASIAGPTDAFRGCLREAVVKARSDKIAGNTIETYLKKACTAQMSTLKGAVIAFRTKNGMSHKAAVDDADMTVDDYVSTPADNYKFAAEANAPKAAESPPTMPGAAPPATPAAAMQPPKP